MSVTTVGGGGATLDMGRVVSQMLRVIPATFVPLMLANLGVWALSLVAVAVAIAVSAVADTLSHNTASGPLTGVVAVLFPLIYLVLIGAQLVMVYASVSKAAVGERITVRGAYALALKHLWPLFAIGVLAGLGIFAGMMLFFIPGIILGLVWAVVVPVQVVERTGILPAFSRSAELTRNNRMLIFLINLVVGFVSVIAFYLVLFIVVAIAGGVGLATGLGAQPASTHLNAASLVILPVIAVLYAVFFTGYLIVAAALPAAIYSELIRLKGGGPDTAAAVFT